MLICPFASLVWPSVFIQEFILSKQVKSQDTRERLLAAGLSVFATRGYAGATVREISDTAGCNLASISYYFGDKAGCYQVVRKHAHKILREMIQRCWSHIDSDPWLALRTHIDILLDHTYDSTMSHINWILLRELLGSKKELQSKQDPEREQQIQIYEQRMTALLSALLGNAANDDNISLLRYTYHSLCLFLSIQTHAEQYCFEGKPPFSLGEKHDKTFLTEYILNLVRHAVNGMQSEQSRTDCQSVSSENESL